MFWLFNSFQILLLKSSKQYSLHFPKASFPPMLILQKKSPGSSLVSYSGVAELSDMQDVCSSPLWVKGKTQRSEVTLQSLPKRNIFIISWHYLYLKLWTKHLKTDKSHFWSKFFYAEIFFSDLLVHIVQSCFKLIFSLSLKFSVSNKPSSLYLW